MQKNLTIELRKYHTEFTCGLWKPETVTGFSGRIQLGRAGPVELTTEVKVKAPLEEG